MANDSNDVNAWDLYGNTIKLICEDYLFHNTIVLFQYSLYNIHCTFRAWLLPLSFIIGQP